MRRVNHAVASILIVFATLVVAAPTRANEPELQAFIKKSDQPKQGMTPAEAGAFQRANPNLAAGSGALVATLPGYQGITGADFVSLVERGEFSTVKQAFGQGINVRTSGIDPKTGQVRWSTDAENVDGDTPIIILPPGPQGTGHRAVVGARCGAQPWAITLLPPQQPAPPPPAYQPPTAGVPGAMGPAGPQGPQGLPGVPGTSFPGAPANATAIAGMGGSAAQPIIIVMPPQQAAAPAYPPMPQYPPQAPPVIYPPQPAPQGDKAFLNGLTIAPSLDFSKVEAWQRNTADSHDQTRVDAWTRNNTDVDAWTRNNVEAWTRNTSDTNVQDLSRIDANWLSNLDARQVSLLQQTAPWLFQNGQSTNNSLNSNWCNTSAVYPPNQQCQYGCDRDYRCLPPSPCPTPTCPTTCPPGYDYVNGQCQPRHGTNGCPAGQQMNSAGQCVPITTTCRSDEYLVNGQCVPRCPTDHIWDGQYCRPRHGTTGTSAASYPALMPGYSAGGDIQPMRPSRR